jgi:phosphoheptose isomerase
MSEAAQVLTTCFARGGKVLICGDGHNAADAEYLTASLVTRFQWGDQPGLPALSLNAAGASLRSDSADGMCLRQVKTFGQPDDVLIGISTHGVSRFLVHVFKLAHQRSLRSITLIGGHATEWRRLVDVMLTVPSSNRQSVEKVHLVLMHLLCGLVDERLAAGDRQTSTGGTVRAMWELPRRWRVTAGRARK